MDTEPQQMSNHCCGIGASAGGGGGGGRENRPLLTHPWGGGVIWGHGQPQRPHPPTHPPTHIRKVVLGGEMKTLKEARKWRPI